jgi:hypothetical protein
VAARLVPERVQLVSRNASHSRSPICSRSTPLDETPARWCWPGSVLLLPWMRARPRPSHTRPLGRAPTAWTTRGSRSSIYRERESPLRDLTLAGLLGCNGTSSVASNRPAPASRTPTRASGSCRESPHSELGPTRSARHGNRRMQGPEDGRRVHGRAYANVGASVTELARSAFHGGSRATAFVVGPPLETRALGRRREGLREHRGRTI